MASRIGNQLQETRRRKEISLSVVSEETKIGKKYLEALEREEYDVFPAKVYAVSFLRSYARYLGLDAESLVEIYQKEHSGRRERMEINPKLPIMPTQHSGENFLSREGIATFRSKRRGLFVFFLTIVVVVGTGLRAIFWLQSASHELSQQRLSKINARGIVPKNISLVLEAKDETWLRVVGDNEVSFEGTVFPGEKRRWIAKNEMKVRIGNINGVKLYVNGKKVDGISGSVRGINDLTFTMLEGKGLVEMEQKRVPRMESVGPSEGELQKEER